MKPYRARSAWGKVFGELVNDGEWHDVEKVIATVARAVPAGVALRRYQSNVDYKRRDLGHSPRIDTHTDDGVRQGRRRIARTLIDNGVLRGRLEVRGGMVRLKPSDDPEETR